MAAIVTVSCAVSNRESRYPRRGACIIATLNTQRTTLNDILVFSAKAWEKIMRYSKIRATSPKCILYESTTPYYDRYSQKCRFYSQHLQNGHFFTTHVGNQTVPLILVFFWETFKYYSLWMYSTRIAFVRSNLANLSEMFFKSELILVQNV